MNITSSAFSENQEMPSRYTCDGESVNPELEIDGVPGEAMSLALILDDPDAPSGRFVHWVVWNIDPQTHTIGEHSVPPGAVEGLTSARKQGYVGPCPPSGTHHYRFKVFALDTRLDLAPNASIELVEKLVADHQVDSAQLTCLYSRR